MFGVRIDKREAFTADDLAEVLDPVFRSTMRPVRRSRNSEKMTTTGGSRRAIRFPNCSGGA